VVTKYESITGFLLKLPIKVHIVLTECICSFTTIKP